MATGRPRLRCPKCGAEMNPHAEKLIVVASGAEPGFDDALGGVVEETSSCPRCGNVEARRV